MTRVGVCPEVKRIPPTPSPEARARGPRGPLRGSKKGGPAAELESRESLDQQAGSAAHSHLRYYLAKLPIARLARAFAGEGRVPRSAQPSGREGGEGGLGPSGVAAAGGPSPALAGARFSLLAAPRQGQERSPPAPLAQSRPPSLLPPLPSLRPPGRPPALPRPWPPFVPPPLPF